MSISEQIFYLKDGGLYKVTAGALRAVTAEDMLAADKPSLMIDDKYFFYVGMDGVSVTGKKLRAIASNYLGTLFPSDMVKSFGVSQHGGAMIIYLLSDELIALTESDPEIFQKARRISTPFIEAASAYEDFLFFDGLRKYRKKAGEILLVSQDDDNFMTAESFIAEHEQVKNSIQLPGLKKAGMTTVPFVIPAIAVAVCYALFVIGSIFDVIAASKADAYYNTALQRLYTDMGVADKSDPYGMLLYKSKQLAKNGQGKRVLATLNELADFTEKGAELNVMSIRDKNIRVEGLTADFAKIEELGKFMQDKIKTNVSMDDTKKTDKGVTFVMRYEYQ